MLRGIDPVLNGNLLQILDEMGHGDELALVDRNFPAVASGRPVRHLGEISLTRAAEAILGVLPLDTFIERPIGRMEVDADASVVNAVQLEVLEIARAHHAVPLEYEVITRFDFYARSKSAFAVVQTLETRPYGCVLFTKGVV